MVRSYPSEKLSQWEWWEAKLSQWERWEGLSQLECFSSQWSYVPVEWGQSEVTGCFVFVNVAFDPMAMAEPETLFWMSCSMCWDFIDVILFCMWDLIMYCSCLFSLLLLEWVIECTERLVKTSSYRCSGIWSMDFSFHFILKRNFVRWNRMTLEGQWPGNSSWKFDCKGNLNSSSNKEFYQLLDQMSSRGILVLDRTGYTVKFTVRRGLRRITSNRSRNLAEPWE